MGWRLGVGDGDEKVEAGADSTEPNFGSSSSDKLGLMMGEMIGTALRDPDVHPAPALIRNPTLVTKLGESGVSCLRDRRLMGDLEGVDGIIPSVTVEWEMRSCQRVNKMYIVVTHSWVALSVPFDRLSGTDSQCNRHGGG